MAERKGIRKILLKPWVYDLFQWMVGSPRARRIFLGEHAVLLPGERVLDVGCGTGEILASINGADYVGIDHNAAYIDKARERFGAKGAFHCAASDGTSGFETASFDAVLAVFLLHHLEDVEVRRLLQEVRRLLKPGGRFISIDPCLVDGQSSFARFLIRRDRGMHVRTQEQYEAMSADIFPDRDTCLRHDLLNIPYTHCIVRCRAGVSGESA